MASNGSSSSEEDMGETKAEIVWRRAQGRQQAAGGCNDGFNICQPEYILRFYSNG